jgi:flavin-binding protein dodecin
LYLGSNNEMTTQVAKIVEVAKITEVVGCSKKNWQDAAQEAVREAKKLQDALYASVREASLGMY